MQQWAMEAHLEILLPILLRRTAHAGRSPPDIIFTCKRSMSRFVLPPFSKSACRAEIPAASSLEIEAVGKRRSLLPGSASAVMYLRDAGWHYYYDLLGDYWLGRHGSLTCAFEDAVPALAGVGRNPSESALRFCAWLPEGSWEVGRVNNMDSAATASWNESLRR
ncbi:hypothetical protein M430DRAFT_269489 [Amorphotheca resinae ATCC 22711]|uniref:Uncharacterized protein n=1 Tax=Amorphotheca resinae ATCC 22711 TaxID=857342 RepID=A0A2T3BFJ8_AMORE|nr:hypothetical protein M430DRAFT_269489 [Amorphotheca resinae ATCC 22711]PSS28108.1 hypothetical protein M430DRAFT_269489 [Amorphotheca resinae ATCC 22711]